MLNYQREAHFAIQHQHWKPVRVLFGFGAHHMGGHSQDPEIEHPTGTHTNLKICFASVNPVKLETKFHRQETPNSTRYKQQ